MSIRKVSFAPMEFYHVYNRGNSKQKIFHDKEDYERFINLLYSVNSNKNVILRLVKNEMYSFDRGDTLVDIGAYCLMPNHFHILITQNDNGDISKFMQKLTTAYSMYYNKKYSRTGGLFEGKFKSEYVGEDRYLKYLFSYIHLNPVKLIDKNWRNSGILDKQKIIKYLMAYRYSSFQNYLNSQRPENSILNIESFPNYFNNKDKFLQEIFEWFSFKKKIKYKARPCTSDSLFLFHPLELF